MAVPTPQQMEEYIRRQAVAMGIDPDIAVRVAKSEGLQSGTWQSNVQQPYGREASYGPYQLHVDPTGRRPGMGNDFMKATGHNPANPDTWSEGIDYALKQAREGGWGPWMGAKAQGITGMMGIGQASEAQQVAYHTDDTPAMGAAMGGFATGPGDVQNRMDTGTVAGLLDEQPSWLESNGADLAALGLSVLKKSQNKKNNSAPEAPQAQVLQPLRRVTLGKGLL